MRKLTASLLAGALTISALAPVALADDKGHGKGNRPKYEQDFKDWQEDYWANESLARMITRGVIKGNDDATIASFRSVTRLESAIMMSRLLELNAPDMPTGQFTIQTTWGGQIKVTNTKTEFTIVLKTAQGEFKLQDAAAIPDWGRSAVLTALRDGFLIYDGASLSPMKALNRLEAAVMMVKAAGLEAQAQALAGASLDFKDASGIPSQLRGYVAIAVENGFVTGYEDGTFRAMQTLTRAEWAALLDRLDRQNGAPVTHDGRQIKATVTGVTSNGVTVTTPVYPGGVTYRLDAQAVIYKGGKEISLAEINVDDQVIINLDSDRQIALLTVINAMRQVNGTVDAFVKPTASVTGSIRLSGNGTTRTFTVNSQTKVMRDGHSATFADVNAGDQVSLKVDGNVVKEITLKAETQNVVGTLQSISFGSNSVLPSVTLKNANNVQTTYRIADFATIKAADGTALTLGDLDVGDQVTLKLEGNLVTSIQVRAAAPVQTANGQVTAFVGATSGVSGAITIRDGSASATYTVTGSTKVVLGDRTASFADVRVGDRVSLKLDGSKVTQITIRTDSATVIGTLADISLATSTRAATLKLTAANNLSTTYNVAANVTVKDENGTAISLADLNVGDQLQIRVERGLITAILVKVNSAIGVVNGQVTAFVGAATGVTGAITIRDGSASATYTVTSSTKVMLGGKTATFGDVRIGDRVSLKVDGSKVTEIAIKTDAVTITGTLEAVTAASGSQLATLKLKGANNVSTTYTVAANATVKNENGTAIALADLEAGDQITLKLERNLVTGIQIKVSAVKTLEAKVEAFVSPTSSVAGALSVRANGTSATYTVTSATTVKLDGKSATFADIRVGDQVTLTLDGTRVTQIAIAVEKMTVTGKLEIVAMGGGSIPAAITVKANGVSTSYTLGANVSIKNASGATIQLDDLNAGDTLTLTVERNLVTAIRVQ